MMVCASAGLPLVIPESSTVCCGAFWFSARLPMGLSVGGSFTVVTANWNVLLTLDAPSLRITVMAAAPVWFAAGVRVTVREAPEGSPPGAPNAMLFVGTRLVFDDAERS